MYFVSQKRWTSSNDTSCHKMALCATTNPCKQLWRVISLQYHDSVMAPASGSGIPLRLFPVMVTVDLWLLTSNFVLSTTEHSVFHRALQTNRGEGPLNTHNITHNTKLLSWHQQGKPRCCGTSSVTEQHHVLLSKVPNCKKKKYREKEKRCISKSSHPDDSVCHVGSILLYRESWV